MDVRQQHVLLIEPNKYEGQILTDLLRFAGVQEIRTETNAVTGLEAVAGGAFTLILMELDCEGVEGVAFTRRLRRMQQSPSRKATVVLLTKRLSRPVAEACRIAGANAAIAKPVSGATLVSTLNKVFANPRPFVEDANYVGPCRRAGIVTAVAQRRRRSDVEIARPGADVRELIARALTGVDDLVSGRQARAGACEDLLDEIRERAAQAEDGPLMRVSAALANHLDARESPIGRAAIGACVDGLGALASAGGDPERAEIAERVCDSIARATRAAA
ncbi:MAG: response regulator [Alphaproteobacteria bacterium]|nr:response regulator [Alphaproteobacteria bacterium]